MLTRDKITGIFCFLTIVVDLTDDTTPYFIPGIYNFLQCFIPNSGYEVTIRTIDKTKKDSRGITRRSFDHKTVL
jgi:hypothetical protein